MKVKVCTEYKHDPADLSSIYLAMVPVGESPKEEDWVGAFRDIIDGKYVVRTAFDEYLKCRLWIRDRSGERLAKRFSLIS